MKNFKIINKGNLLFNLSRYKGKKICAMVKADAYGHGLREVVEAAKGSVHAFGVVSEAEGRAVRRLCDNPIILCSKAEDFAACARHDLQVIVDDEADLRKAVRFGLKDNLHLKINCGMNRFGVSSHIALRQMDAYLNESGIQLKSISTHFPRTESRHATMKNYNQFLALRADISQKAEICFGGSGIYGYNFSYQILRLGIGLYGYGQKGLRPVMRIISYVKKILFVGRGQRIGYGTAFKARADGFFAIVPVGYGDGLRRNLSGKFSVKINGKKYQSVGNICMDCFFVKIDSSVSVGDEVEVLGDAQDLAEKSGTISYEILTGFSNFRGRTKIE